MKIASVKIPFWLTIIPVSLLILIFSLWQNNHLTINNIEFSSEKLPKTFNGFTILQISDLHNKEFGKDNQRLLKKISKIAPSIIVITGDLVDSRRTNIRAAVTFVREAVKLAPVYYVSGNHESRSTIYKELFPLLEDAGASVIDNSKLFIDKEGSGLELYGVSDPTLLKKAYGRDSDDNIMRTALTKLINKDNEHFTILLSHRPELIEVYAEYELDLVFSGHAHGGQIRIPFVGGLLAPGQGFFPKYTSGIHRKKKTSLVISRGLGNSAFPVRVFNRPELVVVTLKSKD